MSFPISHADLSVATLAGDGDHLEVLEPVAFYSCIFILVIVEVLRLQDGGRIEMSVKRIHLTYQSDGPIGSGQRLGTPLTLVGVG